MPSNILPEGDDQKWKKEVDRVLAELQRRVEALAEEVERIK